MAIDFGQHGLDYTRELCSAIEAYTAHEIRLFPSAFFYRSLNLRYAVERELYIQGINSEPLFLHYLSRVSSVSVANLPVLDPVESYIAFFFRNLSGHYDHSARRIIGRSFYIARCASDWLRRWRPRAFFAPLPMHGPIILIHVHNFKFVNYLSPVTRELHPDEYGYLITHDAELADQLDLRGLPVARAPYIRNIFSLRHNIFCSYALSGFTGLMHLADTTIAALSRLQPKCTLVVEGNAPTNVITAEVCRIIGIPCYCVQQGWSPFVHTGFRNMCFKEMFVWGEFFAQSLLPYNPNQPFNVTGSHAIQSVDISASRTTVDTISFFLQAPCALLAVKAYDDFVSLIVDVAKSYSRLRVIVREHPGFPLSSKHFQKLHSFPNVQFSTPSAEPLAEVIQQSDLVVSVFSTVLLEALALNVVPLICSIGALRHYEPAIAAAGAAIEVQSVAEARSMIDQLIVEPARLERIRWTISQISHKYFCRQDAAKVIASRLSEYG